MQMIDTYARVAKLMATENITVVHSAKARTASMDTISRVLTLPVWNTSSEDVYTMLTAHEVGHALFTPATLEAVEAAYAQIDEKNKSVAHAYLNIVEDARIERLMKAKFPGLRRPFTEAYRELFNDGKFGKIKDVSKLPLIDRVNLYFKIGAHINVPFTKDEQVLVDMVAAARTWDDVVEAAKAIYKFAGKKPKKKKKRNPQHHNPTENRDMGEMDPADPADSDEDSSGESSSDETDTDSDEESSGDSSGEPSSDETDTDSNEGSYDKDSSDEDSNEESLKSNGSDENVPPASQTQHVFDRAMERMTENQRNQENVYVGEADLDKIVIDYKTVIRDFESVRINHKDTEVWQALSNELRKSVNVMVKQFEMKKAADGSKRVMTARSGELDANRLYSYKMSDDIFLRRNIVKDDKNHGLVLFLDWSSSMMSGDTLQHTMRQLASMMMFCKKVGIPFEVFAFSDEYRLDNTYQGDSILPKNFGYNITGCNVALLNIATSRGSTDEIRKMEAIFGRLYQMASGDVVMLPPGWHLSCTPLNETIFAASTIVKKFKQRENVQIVHTFFLTDGTASNFFGASVRSPSGRIESGYNAMFIDPISGHRMGFPYTEDWVRLFKSRVPDSRAIGIFLTDGRNLDRDVEKFSGRDDTAYTGKMWNDFVKNGFCHIDNADGYTDFFIINTEMKTEKVKVDQDFTGFMNAQMNDKVLLGRIVSLIADIDHTKKVSKTRC